MRVEPLRPPRNPHRIAVALAGLLVAPPARAGPHALGGLFGGMLAVLMVGAAAVAGSMVAGVSRRPSPSVRDAALLNLVAVAIALGLFGLATAVITGGRGEDEATYIFVAGAPVALAAGQIAQRAAVALRRDGSMEAHRVTVALLVGIVAAAAYCAVGALAIGVGLLVTRR